MYLARATLRNRQFGHRVPGLSVLRWALTLIALLASSAASAVAAEAEVAQTTSQTKAAPSAGSAPLNLEGQAVTWHAVSWHTVRWQISERWGDALVKFNPSASPRGEQPALQLAAATHALSPKRADALARPRNRLLRAALQPRAPPSC